MKNKKWSCILIALLLLSTGIVLGVGNGTPFVSSESAKLDTKLINESGEVATVIVEDSGDIPEITIYSGEADQSSQSEENEVVKAGNHNIMLLGKELDVTGEAKDLIMVAGAKITSKALGSYAFMMASDLNISGEIFQDTFAVGNEIKMDGIIGRDLYTLGNTIDIDGDVARDVFAGGEEISIRGNIGGDVKIAGDSVYIASGTTIAGDMDLYANEVQIEDGAKIEGTVTYNSNVQTVAIPQNVKTRINEVKETEIPTENKFITELKSMAWWIAANGILFAILMLIFPGMFRNIKTIYQEDTMQRFCSSCGWGILSIFVIPFVSILCLFTLIGSAVGFIGLLLYIIGFMIATAITGYAIVNALIEKNMNPFLKGLLGIIIIEILRRLPVIGGIIGLIVNAIAFGTVLKLIKASNANKEKEVIETEKTEE